MNNSIEPSSFKLIFEHSPIPLWEMDLTELFEYFESLKLNGIKDLDNYLEKNPQELVKCLSLNTIKLVNTAVLALYEVENQQELIDNTNLFLSEYSIDTFKKQLNHFFQGNLSFTSDTEILTKSRKTKTIRLKINIHKELEQIIGILSTENISELKLLDKQFKELMSSSPDSVSISRVSDGKFVFANEIFKQILGFSDEDIKNKTALELGMWVNIEDRNNFFKEIKENGFVNNISASFKEKNGQVREALVSAKTIDYLGEPHIVVSSKDVTKSNELTRNIKKSEENFRKAFMNIPDAVHINRISDATFVDINDYFLKYTGYTREEILGKTPEDLNIWFDNLSSKTYYRQLKNKGYINDFEITFRMKDGSLLNALISSNIIDLNGEPHLVNVTRDISKFKEAQEELKRSEEKFQSIFSFSPDALAIMEMINWTYVNVNEMFANICGYSRNEILGKSTFELNLWTLDSDRSFFTSKLQNREDIINHESLFTLSNGSQIHMLVSAKLIEIAGQKLYLLIAKNIEDFVNIRKTLFEKDDRYKAIVSNSNEGIAIIDDTLHIEYSNHQLEIITGYSSDELLGLDFREILTKESAKIVGEKYVARQAGKEISQNYAFEIVRKNGEIRKVEIHSSVIKTAEGILQTIAQLLDITDRENANKIIENKHKIAKQYFDVAGMMMIALDANGIISAVNKKGCEVLEATEENIVGKNWFSDFVPKNLRDQHRERFIKSMENEKFHDDYFENTIKTSTGKEKNIAWRNSLLKDENKNIIGTISSGEDFSAREEASRILNLSGMVAFLLKNSEGWPVEFVSDNVKNLLGYTAEDFYSGNLDYFQLIHPDDRDWVGQEVKKYSEEKRSNFTHQPYRIIAKNGDVKWISDRSTMQYDSEMNITHYYGIISDITDEISKSEKLRQSNEILSQMNDGVVITDFSGVISDWSGGAEKIFGYDNEEMVGENIQLIWDTEIEAKQQLANILSDINIFGFYQKEIPCLGKHKHKIPTELSAKILYDSSDKPLSLILVIRDITNRKIAQKALEDSENSYRHIFESILDGVIIYNMNKEIVQVNKMATQMYGYSYDEFTQKTTSRYIYPIQNHDFDDVLNHLDNNYTKMFEGESVDITKSGDKFFVNAKGRLIFYNNEAHLLIIVRDITKIKQTEHDLFKAKEKAIESEQLKSAFLANMSHEIRTPMNSIIGFSDLMDDEDMSAEEKKHFLRIIRQNGNQLLCLINDIIDISKIEAGQVQLNYEQIDLCETFQDLYNMFEIAVKDKGVKLIKKVPHSENEFFVKTDDTRLKQILINLISNALKFTSNGSIEFGCNIIDDEKSIHFYVKDTGIGISKDKQETIFHRFIQADQTTTKLYGGTGLGLAISLGLVSTFKGKLWLESEEEKGSTFNFAIPLIVE